MKLASSHKLNTQIYSEASDWLVEFRSGDVDVAGRTAFYAWLRTSPEHMRAYLEVAAIWNEGSRLDPNRRFDDQDLIQQVRSEDNVVSLEGYDSPRSPHSPLSSSSAARQSGWRVRLLAAAASILVTVCGVWAYSERNTYATGIGEQRSLALVDGSIIELNAASKIRVRFTADRRNIDLIEGQALFHVAKDKTRPFIVNSDQTQVRAVGTEFDVYRRMNGTTVTVIEGRVAVLPSSTFAPVTQNSPPVTEGGSNLERAKGQVFPGRNSIEFPSPPRKDRTTALRSSGNVEELLRDVKNRRNAGQAQESEDGAAKGEALTGDGSMTHTGEFLLAAGEQAILTTEATVKPKQPDIAAATAWTQRRLVFQSARLAEVAEEFNRYNTRRLVIKDPQLADFHITGVFASTDPGSLIRFLQARPGIMIIENTHEILITQRSE